MDLEETLAIVMGWTYHDALKEIYVDMQFPTWLPPQYKERKVDGNLPHGVIPGNIHPCYCRDIEETIKAVASLNEAEQHRFNTRFISNDMRIGFKSPFVMLTQPIRKIVLAVLEAKICYS